MLAFLGSLPDDSVDLLCCSPPYETARTYSIGFAKAGQEWVDWMVAVVRAAAPKVKGLIAVVCEGQTRKYRYSATPFLLAADLHRAGLNLRKPVAFHRVGIPGSGGPDWLRNDWEPVICVTRPGRLPWSENTACGHPPKCPPGGDMSYRLPDGTRINDPRRKRDRGNNLGGRKVSGEKLLGSQSRGRPGYLPPAIANPGNVTSLGKIGGGHMGHKLAHENEAPYPLRLAEFFVRSFCPPGGVCCDPFAGSGTTCHAAVMHGRRFVGADVRESQVSLVARRMATVTPPAPQTEAA